MSRLSVAVALLALGLPVLSTPADDGIPRLRSRHVSLGTEVVEAGLSPLKGLRLYVTRDGGRTWSRPIPQKSQGPVSWEAPEDGTYGFRLCGVDAVGNAQPGPEAGEEPQISLRIDTRPPSVALKGNGTDPLAFSWAAQDEDAVAGVRVEASDDDGETWKEAARGGATGEGSLSSARSGILLRAIARDLAGNRGTSALLRLTPQAPARPAPPAPPKPEPVTVPEPPEVDQTAAARHFATATLYRLNGKTDLAEAEYLRALDAAPRHVQALNDLGILLFRIDDRREEGILRMAEARLLAPGDPDVAFNLGYALLATGRSAQAVPHLKAAAEGLPEGARDEAGRLLERARKESR